MKTETVTLTRLELYEVFDLVAQGLHGFEDALEASPNEQEREWNEHAVELYHELYSKFYVAYQSMNNGYCIHNNYVGGSGADNICSYCEAMG